MDINAQVEVDAACTLEALLIMAKHNINVNSKNQYQCHTDQQHAVNLGCKLCTARLYCNMLLSYRWNTYTGGRGCVPQRGSPQTW